MAPQASISVNRTYHGVLHQGTAVGKTFATAFVIVIVGAGRERKHRAAGQQQREEKVPGEFVGFHDFVGNKKEGSRLSVARFPPRYDQVTLTINKYGKVHALLKGMNLPLLILIV